LEESAFDPEAVKVITIAFDKALATLNLVGRVDPLTDIVARKIIDVAGSGERDAIRLCELALDQLGR
jgi:hypothetical protein